MILKSYIASEWVAGAGEGRPLVNPVNGQVLATASAEGLDVEKGLAYARVNGVQALAQLSFAQRGALLKSIAGVLVGNRDKYIETARLNSGNTAVDASIDIDGGIGTLKYYAFLGSKLGDAKFFNETSRDQLTKEPIFCSQHFLTSRPGVGVQINAFNFPSWGMWEKAAVALLSGVPSFAKPATSTALLSYEMMHDVISADIVPNGVLSLLCGSGEGLFTGLSPMDSIAFTGSAATANMLRTNNNIVAANLRMNIEADSVNATILGPDVTVGSALFNLALKETVKALSIKAGQLCTNIRRVFVCKKLLPDFEAALSEKIAALVVGDPSDAATRVGPLINVAQQKEALSNIATLKTETTFVASAPLPSGLAENSSFVAPTLLRSADPANADNVHKIEVFGPCVTLLAYDNLDQAIELTARAEGALALSLFSDDPVAQMQVTQSLAPWHGRVLIVDQAVGKNHTGHSIVMPQSVHGGPGRAGGGEELGGLRGMQFHMQRSAIQGSTHVLDRMQQLSCQLQL